MFFAKHLIFALAYKPPKTVPKPEALPGQL
jgi:hypothetical protein